MLLSALAFAAGLSDGTPAAPRISVSEPTAVVASRTLDRVIYLGCQVAVTNLTDCRVVNDGPVDPAAAATAVKLANQMVIPKEMAERAGGHIVIKLNVAP